jgi:hypothetical protein
MVSNTLIKRIGDQPEIVPNPDDFRGWVSDCLVVLSVSASSVSREIGGGKNTVSQFLSDRERGIDLATAHRITAHFRGLAADKWLILPRATWVTSAAHV